MSNISNVTTSAATTLIQKLTASTAKSTASTTSTAKSSDSSKVSTMGDLMKQLDDLAQSDPEKFKATTSNIADQLNQLASTLSGDEASKVSELASKFTKAAKSGDSSSLRPSKPPPAGPPPQGAAAYGQNQSLSANGDSIHSQIDSIMSDALSSLSAS